MPLNLFSSLGAQLNFNQPKSSRGCPDSGPASCAMIALIYYCLRGSKVASLARFSLIGWIAVFAARSSSPKLITTTPTPACPPLPVFPVVDTRLPSPCRFGARGALGGLVRDRNQIQGLCCWQKSVSSSQIAAHNIAAANII